MKKNNQSKNAIFVFYKINAMINKIQYILLLISICFFSSAAFARERVLINEGWKFYKYSENEKPDNLIYEPRPETGIVRDDKPADAKPTEKVAVSTIEKGLKPWILPSGNEFIDDDSKKYVRPEGNPGGVFPFVQVNYNDKAWESINLPHDWAIKGPFYVGEGVPVGGGMGRLPVQGVAWYRKKLDIPVADRGKSIILEVDGAMSYAIVWCNGNLVGGWPYGYNSWHLDLTPYIVPGKENQLAIRLDNPANSARWYPGAGIYRNVWLTKTSKISVAQWGTTITTSNVTKQSADVDIKVDIKNKTGKKSKIAVYTEFYPLDDSGKHLEPASKTSVETITIQKNSSFSLKSKIKIENPRLWGPVPEQKPNLYKAVTYISQNKKVIDTYQTVFGIRDIKLDPNSGVIVNGEKITLKGSNLHHDLGSIGAAYNQRAAERQLEMLQDAGCNAIRISHNPPAPEFLELTDKMGFLVIDEVFDSWQTKKTPHDFHLIFDDWHEQDIRAMIRRDKNHPSVFVWSFGNEVGEQYTDKAGAMLAEKLYTIVKDEDSTRPTTIAMNYAKPGMPLPAVPDIIGLNYQGEGIRNAGPYSHLKGINTPPMFPAFHEKYPEKVILSSENASALSTRGAYLFPVFDGESAPIRDGQGGDSKNMQVSAYELYSSDFGSSADKVFASTDKNPFVAGGFVWTGWDHLGEPTPYYSARSSYCGLIDLAGFKKDRFYLYKSYWRPNTPLAHILPHWTWPERFGKVTPVHVMTSGDEAELFLNGYSLGRKKKGQYEYRLRWDDVLYQPGTLKVVTYKNGNKWAEDSVVTAGNPFAVVLNADKSVIKSDGCDIVFITASIVDEKGNVAPRANNRIYFSIEGPGEIIATDNGFQGDMQSFASKDRQAFNGLCLVIIRSKKGETGKIKVTANSDRLKDGGITISPEI